MGEVYSGCAVRALAQGWEPGRHQEGDAEFRNVLRERWADGPMIGFVGMNPSDASAEKTDPTWLRWRGFAQRWGYAGQIVVNPVPKRSPSPDDAIAWLKAIADGFIDSSPLIVNQQCVRRVAPEAVAWVLGWGDKGAAMNDAYRVHSDFIGALRGGAGPHIPFLAFGLTASGNPKHVLARGTSRIPDDASVFEIEPMRKRITKTVYAHPHVTKQDHEAGSK